MLGETWAEVKLLHGGHGQLDHECSAPKVFDTMSNRESLVEGDDRWTLHIT